MKQCNKTDCRFNDKNYECNCIIGEDSEISQNCINEKYKRFEKKEVIAVKPFKTKEELRDWAMYIVPEDAKWIAVDKSGFLYGYIKKPILDETNEYWGESYENHNKKIHKVSISFPWQESLIEIKHPIDLTKYIGKVVKIIDNLAQIKYDVLAQGALDLLNAGFLESITPLKHEDIQP